MTGQIDRPQNMASIADKIAAADSVARTLERQTDTLSEAVAGRYGVGSLWLASDPDFLRYLGELVFLCKEDGWWHNVNDRGDEDDICEDCEGLIYEEVDAE